MRVKQCVMCDAPLPPGSRIDRRYCREACRVMACRQRNKQAATSHTRWLASQPAASQERQRRTSAQLSDQIAQVAEELATVKLRVAELEARYQGLVQQGISAGRQDQSAQRPTASQDSEIPRVRPDGETTAPKLTAVQAVPPGGERKPPAPELPPPIDPLPWMVPSPDNPSALVPKWTLLRADMLTEMDEKIAGELPRLPEILSRGGLEDVAKQVRSVFSSEFPLIQRVAKAMARRIVCTKLSERESQDQIGNLLALAGADLANPQRYKDTAEREELVRFISGNSTAIGYLGIFLILILKTTEGIIETSEPKSGLDLIIGLLRSIR